MPVAGRKPKPEGQRRNRTAPVHDWTEVESTPYAGPVPRLPVRYVTTEDGGTVRAKWPAATRRWWEVVSRMPHCRLWSEADWQFAVDTAEVHARWAEGRSSATELRIREKLLGTTLDARRDLRIRYVEPKKEAPVESAAGVVKLDDYRELYGG